MATTPYFDLNSLSSSLVPSISVSHQKDYSRPLHVDCSVEYELPNAAKPPVGARSEPLLMIHPCYYRRVENQRRCPFINNLPIRNSGQVTTNSRRSRASNNNFINQPHLNLSRHNHCLNQNHYPTNVHTNHNHNQCNIHQHPPVRYLEPILTPIKSVKNSSSDQFNNNNTTGLVQSYNHSSSTDSGVWTDSERSPTILTKNNSNSDILCSSNSNSFNNNNVPSVLSENFTNIHKNSVSNSLSNINNNVINNVNNNNNNNNCEVLTNGLTAAPARITAANSRVTRNNNYHVPSNQQPYYQENEKVLSGFTAYVSKISQRSHQRTRRRFLDLGLPLLHSCDNLKPGLAMTVA